jgi:hypothetical protein
MREYFLIIGGLAVLAVIMFMADDSPALNFWLGVALIAVGLLGLATIPKARRAPAAAPTWQLVCNGAAMIFLGADRVWAGFHLSIVGIVLMIAFFLPDWLRRYRETTDDSITE